MAAVAGCRLFTFKCTIFILKSNGRVAAYEIQLAVWLDTTLQAPTQLPIKMPLRGVRLGGCY